MREELLHAALDRRHRREPGLVGVETRGERPDLALQRLERRRTGIRGLHGLDALREIAQETLERADVKRGRAPFDERVDVVQTGLQRPHVGFELAERTRLAGTELRLDPRELAFECGDRAARREPAQLPSHGRDVFAQALEVDARRGAAFRRAGGAEEARPLGRRLERALAVGDLGYRIAEATAPQRQFHRRGAILRSRKCDRRGLRGRRPRRERIEHGVELLLESVDGYTLAARRAGFRLAMQADLLEPCLEPGESALDRVRILRGEARFDVGQALGERRDAGLLARAAGLRGLQVARDRGQRVLGTALVALGARLDRRDGFDHRVFAALGWRGGAGVAAFLVANDAEPPLRVVAIALGPLVPALPVALDDATARPRRGGAQALEPRRDRVDPVMFGDVGVAPAALLGNRVGAVGDDAMQPLAKRKALATRGIASRLAGIETHAVDVPG